MGLKKRLAAVGVAVIAALSLTGCMRADTEIWVNENAEVSQVGAVIAFDKAKLQQLGSMGGMGGMDSGTTSSDVPTDLNSFKEMMLADSPDRAKMEEMCTFTESATEWIMTCKGNIADFNPDAADLAEFADEARFTKDGDTIKVNVATEATSTQDASSAAMFGITARLLIHLPGPVSNVSGAGASIDPNDPNTLIINILETDGTPVTATAEVSGGGLPWALIGGGLIGLLLIAGGVVFFLNRQGGGYGGGPVPPVPPTQGNGYGQPNYQQQGYDPYQPYPHAQQPYPQQPMQYEPPMQAPQQPYPPQAPQAPQQPMQPPQQPYPPQMPPQQPMQQMPPQQPMQPPQQPPRRPMPPQGQMPPQGPPSPMQRPFPPPQ